MRVAAPPGLKAVLGQFKRQYFSVLGFSAIINLLMLAPSWYMLEIYDRALTSRDDNTLFGLSAIVVFLYVVYALLERYRGLVLIEVSETLEELLAPKIHRGLITPAMVQRKPDMSPLLNDLNTLKQFLTGQPILSFLDTPWVFIFLAVTYLLHPALGLVATVSTLAVLLLALLNQRLTSTRIADAQQASAQERQLVTTALGANESVQTMGMRPAVQNRLKRARQKYLDSLLGASTLGVHLSSLSKFFRTLIQSAMLGYGAYLAIQNELSAGAIVAASILLGRTLAPLDGVINAWRQLADFRKAFSNIDEVIGNGVVTREHTVRLERPQGRLELRNVSLRLREQGRPTLDQVNLTIEPRETVAIIGPSGAGKTSLLKTLAGIYTPHQGQNLLDGSDLAYRDLDDLGQHIGYLGQTTELMAGRLSENIARFGPVDSARVLEAARLAGAHAMLMALPEGYETVLGDQGRGLSEGQKRKVGIARALYGSPAIVFLDEPGAGLDDASLAALAETLKALKQRRVTTVFTTHQRPLALLADKAAVVVDGQVKLFGPARDVFARLMAAPTPTEGRKLDTP